MFGVWLANQGAPSTLSTVLVYTNVGYLSEYYIGLTPRFLPVFIVANCLLSKFHVLYDKGITISALVNWVNSFSGNQQDQLFILKLFSVTSANSSSIPPTCILWIPSWISTRVCWMRLLHRNTLKALTECPAHRCVPRNWHDMTWHDVTWRDMTWDVVWNLCWNFIQRLHIFSLSDLWI